MLGTSENMLGKAVMSGVPLLMSDGWQVWLNG